MAALFWTFCILKADGIFLVFYFVIFKHKLDINAKRTARLLLKGNPKYFGASIAEGHAHFSSGSGFMVGLDKL